MTSVHHWHGITCDECGLAPLAGVRYVATHLFDYDVCSECFRDHHASSDGKRFVAFHRPDPSTKSVCTATDNRIIAKTASEAARKIGRNSPSRYAAFNASNREDTNDDNDTEDATNAVANVDLKTALRANTNLQILSIHMCSSPGEYSMRIVEDIAAGIAGSTSIKIVDWHIGTVDQKRAQVLRRMILESQTLQSLSLGKPCGGLSHASRRRRDGIVCTLFKGLKTNKALKSLRLGNVKLNDETKDVLVKFLQSNQCIRRLHADFVEPDNRIELLLACNREKWLERLAKDASSSQRLDILSMAMHHEKLSDEPVPVAYHLLRNFPEMVLAAGVK